MENKADEKREEQKLIEDKLEKKPPVKLLEKKNFSKEISSKKDPKHADLEKFKRGELGASHIGYNDDGSTHGQSQKMDIDTEADPK